MQRLDQAILFANLFVAQHRNSPCWGCPDAEDCAAYLDGPCPLETDDAHPAMPDADAVREFRQIVYGF